jgi:hypothetical protein
MASPPVSAAPELTSVAPDSREATFRRRYGSLGILGNLAFRLRRWLLTGVLTLMAVEALILYRIFTQVNGSIPAGGLGAWLYSLAGGLIEPFRNYETVTPIHDSAILDLAALVAFEVYFFAGLIMALLAFALTWSLPREVRRHGPRFSLAPAWRASGGAFATARRVYGAADVVAERWTKAGVAYLQARDWPGYAARARSAWLEADRAVAQRAHAIVDASAWAHTRDSALATWRSADKAVERWLRAIIASPVWGRIGSSGHDAWKSFEVSSHATATRLRGWRLSSSGKARAAWRWTDATSQRLGTRLEGWREKSGKRAATAWSAFDAASQNLGGRIEGWRQQNSRNAADALKEADRRAAAFAASLSATVSQREADGAGDSAGSLEAGEREAAERMSRREFLRLPVRSQTETSLSQPER